MTLLQHVALLTFAGILTLSYGQEIALPRINCVIPWGEVSRRGFTVKWTPNNNCASYKVYIVRSYTTIVIEEIDVTGEEYKFDKGSPLTSYGAYVRCMGSNGRMGPRGRPGRTLTFDDPSITTTTFVPPTGSAPVGPCGQGFYTCPDGKCIPASSWCDGVLDCGDNALDERDCPGHCSDIIYNPQFPNSGNMTCSRFNSLDSSCFFGCNNDTGWERRGPWYTVCHNGQWTRRIPECVPFVAASEAIRESDSDVDLFLNVPLGFTGFQFINITTISGISVPINSINIEEISRESGKLLLVEYSVTGFPNDEEMITELVVSAGSIRGNIYHFHIRAVGDYGYGDYGGYDYKK